MSMNELSGQLYRIDQKVSQIVHQQAQSSIKHEQQLDRVIQLQETNNYLLRRLLGAFGVKEGEEEKPTKPFSSSSSSSPPPSRAIV